MPSMAGKHAQPGCGAGIVVKRTPGKVCDNVIGVAILLTLAAMLRHPREMWAIVSGKDSSWQSH